MRPELYLLTVGIGTIFRIIRKVLTGHGLDYYKTFEGFQFDYIGALIAIGAMI